MSLWIVDGGIGFTLPVVARVDDWQENDHIDVTGADENGEWLSEPVRYVKERGTCRLPETRIDHGSIEYNGVTKWRKCSACGAEILAYPARYCPSCGARVVEVDE